MICLTNLSVRTFTRLFSRALYFEKSVLFLTVPRLPFEGLPENSHLSLPRMLYKEGKFVCDWSIIKDTFLGD